MYSFRTSDGPVDLAFTDRVGGVSAAPYDSLNLALASGDDPAAVAHNLAAVRADFASTDHLVDLEQVHGGDVHVVTGTPPAVDSGRPAADAVVTDLPGITLMVRVADCVPLLLADPMTGVIGAAHCGRPGLIAEVVPHAIEAMRDLGARDLVAWIGPHVCGACYEVPAAMQEQVAALLPQARATTSWGTPSLDIGAGVRAQLESAQVRVVDAGRCTRESRDLYSYRRDGAAAGRMAGLIRRADR
ncbi:MULTISPECIES: peptidoglycan editing factor PgeF [Nocardioides]|uniref:Purine nucleoside phosphorylase n=1 Tax=Nocardioides vastitatis TaxID=2568655 RepID=A0ABW0ZBT0_9ACTN|nr:peptidoglycan editing factor PgeF [Nocardioides sp.]THI96414.1 peptidoglycan editing factor PgeF [Nocardioides sp.]